MIKQIIFLIAAIVTSTLAFGQEGEPVKLINPSFEGLPTLSNGPRGWVDCGFPGESAPDVHPVTSSDFGVNTPTYDGETYLGMVVRDNDTWEAVSQYLRQPLRGEQCYKFSIHIARSAMYLSRSRKTNEGANYSTPTTLRIWGGNGACDKRQLLHTTKAIINTRWIEYEMEFRPKQDFTYLTFEAFYRTPVLFPYNGNILLDNAQPIIPIPCNEEEEFPELEEDTIEGADELIVINKDTPGPIAQNEVTEPRSNTSAPISTPELKEPVVKTPKPTPPTPRVAETPKPTPRVTKPQTNETGLDDIAREDLIKGTKIRIKKLYFEADKSDVRADSDGVMEELYNFLQKNEDVIIEIGGYTNDTPPTRYCDSLSTERAKKVAAYLTQKGVEEERVQYKGYGKRDPIANNRTAEGRRRNQRVEIKILGFLSE